ncbi:MAG: hypothetical protein AAF677_17590, partial [Pseudomonadota bacterium]
VAAAVGAGLAVWLGTTTVFWAGLRAPALGVSLGLLAAAAVLAAGWYGELGGTMRVAADLEQTLADLRPGG